MKATKPIPVLYILIRDDIASMNPGKAMAQASHASSAFAAASDGNDLAYQRWQNETSQGFGTVLTLAVNEREMRTAVDIAQTCSFPAAVIHDPTYPLVDGGTVHYIPLDTCAYVFINDKDDPMARAILGNFSLHP